MATDCCLFSLEKRLVQESDDLFNWDDWPERRHWQGQGHTGQGTDWPGQEIGKTGIDWPGQLLGQEGQSEDWASRGDWQSQAGSQTGNWASSGQTGDQLNFSATKPLLNRAGGNPLNRFAEMTTRWPAEGQYGQERPQERPQELPQDDFDAWRQEYDSVLSSTWTDEDLALAFYLGQQVEQQQQGKGRLAGE